jgi:hypothetical protein
MTHKQIQELGNHYRGLIIDKWVSLEKAMDYYIGYYFTKGGEEFDDMFVLILGDERMTFESKRQVFQEIVKKDIPDFYTARPAIAAELQTMSAARNVLAHRVLDTGSDAQALPDNTIRFHKLKNKFEFVIYTVDELDKLYDQMSEINGLLLGNLRPKFVNDI